MLVYSIRIMKLQSIKREQCCGKLQTRPFLKCVTMPIFGRSRSNIVGIRRGFKKNLGALKTSVLDPLKARLSSCYHAEFGRYRSNGVGINREVPHQKSWVRCGLDRRDGDVADP